MALPINSTTVPLVAACRFFAMALRLRGTERLLRRLFNPGTICPCRFEVDLGDLRYRGCTESLVDWNILFYGAYEEPDLLMMEAILDLDSVVLDVGANVGQHALFLSQGVKKVLAFEPNRALHEQFSANISLNGITNIDVFDVALGEADAAAALYLGNDSGGSSLLKRSNDHDDLVSVDVEVRHGDTYLAECHEGAGVDLVKIDVEGYEFSVLRGLRQTIDSNRPIILLEVSRGSRQHFGNPDNFLHSFPDGYGFLTWAPPSGALRRHRLISVSAEDAYNSDGNVYAVPAEKADAFDRAAAGLPRRIQHRVAYAIKVI